MSEIAEKMKAELLRLPTEDRAELAYCLLESLNQGEGPDADPAWEAELGRKAQEMDSGKDPGVPAEQVFAELRKKYP